MGNRGVVRRQDCRSCVAAPTQAGIREGRAALAGSHLTVRLTRSVLLQRPLSISLTSLPQSPPGLVFKGLFKEHG